MSAIGDIIGAIEARLVALGYTPTDEAFSFDAVPSSIIDKAFRIETRLMRNDYHLGGVGNPIEAIDIYIAYKTLRNPRAAWKSALSDRETIEADLISASSISGLSCDPLLRLEGEATVHRFKGEYLVSRLVFSANYLRDF